MSSVKLHALYSLLALAEKRLSNAARQHGQDSRAYQAAKAERDALQGRILREEGSR